MSCHLESLSGGSRVSIVDARIWKQEAAAGGNMPLLFNRSWIQAFCDVAAAASWCDKICIMSPAEVFGNEAIVGIFSSQAIRFSLLALNASFSGVNVNTVPNSTIDNATFTTTE
ncbi:hypothetical protein E4U24_008480 [Claviceps purpurea]|nr:hypothetical protein E4U51_008171 [Claviceps purpurea]KAG6233502.1 hypothetical protein E4U26_001853 [Claviceps purpurea]KAG6253047.1 hypothetical protein E4U24_008480 [Claviceps purpurea]